PVVRGGQPAHAGRRSGFLLLWPYPCALPQLCVALLAAEGGFRDRARCGGGCRGGGGAGSGCRSAWASRHRPRWCAGLGRQPGVVFAACRVRAGFPPRVAAGPTAAGHRCRRDVAGVEQCSAGRGRQGRQLCHLVGGR
ncbi:LOW QUALITY PROTEIN: conserved transmembrane transporter, partial [Mycobacterium tuberculosis EAS054]